MSPTEDDLRRALRHGEDDGPDPGRIVALGEAARAHRRNRVRGGIVAGALVAVVATGGVLLGRSGGDGGSAGGANGAGGALGLTSGSAVPDQDRGAKTAAGSAAGGGPACPAAYPRQLLPGGGSPGRFGSDGPLFAKPVASIVVCGYGTTTGPGRLTGQVRLTRPLATMLAASAEAAAKGRPGCPATVGARTTRQYALLPTATDGSTLRTVTVTLDTTGCPNQVTNGTALRFLWHPPSGLSGVFGSLGRAVTPPGHLHGSPVRS